VPLFTHIADPVERMRLIMGATAQMKNNDKAMSANAIADLSSSIPGVFVGMLGRAVTAIGDRTGRALVCNTGLTNVPGSKQPLYMCGAKMVNVVGGVPLLANMGMAHVVGSYNGIINLSVVACRDLVPDIDFYTQCIEESVDEYRTLTEKAAPGTFKSRPSRSQPKATEEGAASAPQPRRVAKTRAKAAPRPSAKAGAAAPAG
jgi:hypothetical protein